MLLGILVSVAGMSYWERLAVRQWGRPLEIAVYPVNGDGRDDTGRYIDGLRADRFADISAFLERQSARYGGVARPVAPIALGQSVLAPPPAPAPGAGAWENVLWSLKLRYYAFRSTPFFENIGRIRLFVVYHEGEDREALEHSLGLRQGLLGVVHAFARKDQDDQNNVVIAHELLHTLGASDKYGPGGLPAFPDGFGEPDQPRRYPQRTAEIMAGRIAVEPERAVMPESLADCVVGYKTAHEINW